MPPKVAMKRMNSEPSRLPTIQKARESLRQVVNQAAPRHLPRRRFEEEKKQYNPPQSNRGYNPSYQRDQNKENHSALMQAGKYAIPSSRRPSHQKIDLYAKNPPSYRRNRPSSRLNRQKNHNLSHDVRNDHSYLPGRPISRSNSRNSRLVRHNQRGQANPSPSPR